MTPSTLNLSEHWSPEVNKIAPAVTYRVDFVNKRVTGVVDRVDAIIQFVTKALRIDKYAYEIYNWNYGNELYRLLGMPYDFVVAEIPRIIREALTTDDRIIDTVNFSFEKWGLDGMIVQFDIVHIYGKTTYSTEVRI